MYITCCHGCESRHTLCHAHCEAYNTQKILKILVEAQEDKKKRISHGISNQKRTLVDKAIAIKHRKRRT
jgi:hypothetical protein